MKRVVLMLLFLLTTVVFAHAKDENERSIVFINGQRYYVHNVKAGETLYSIARIYEIRVIDIERNNSGVEESGLQVGENLKIPIAESQSSKKKISIKLNRKTFDTHVVAAGETLYAISRQHQISVATIIEDNPEIDPSALAVGQKVLIRKKEMGKSSDEEIIEELTEYKENMNKVVPEGYEYYLVSPKETLYSIMMKNAMSRKEFMEVNNLTSDELKAGDIVLIRPASAAQIAQKEEERRREEAAANGPQELQFIALRGNDTLNVSLLLPLTISGSVAPIFAEFYQGFMLGVEDLKESGRSVNVTLFDTQASHETVKKITETNEFKRSNLIVGPVYEELLGDVLLYAEMNSIPVVSPLATLQNSNSGALFQMAPITEHKYDKIGDLLGSDVQVTLIYTYNTDEQFEAEVKELLAGRRYHTHMYVYEHPTIVAERAAIAKNSETEEKLSPSDLSPLIQGDTTATIFIMSDNETDVDRILSALASAEINLRSRSMRVGNFTVINNSKWNRYTNIDRAMFFRDRVTAFTTYHAKRDSERIQEFDSRYAKSFNTIPSLYSYRGYDVAKIFGEGLYSDIEYGMEGRTFTPLQTTYRFRKIRDKESRANQNWMRANYKNNFTITLE